MVNSVREIVYKKWVCFHFFTTCFQWYKIQTHGIHNTEQRYELRIVVSRENIKKYRDKIYEKEEFFIHNFDCYLLVVETSGGE